MAQKKDAQPQDPEPEPRWPAVVAVLATGALYQFIPERLTPGPNWLLLAVIGVLLIPTILSHRARRSELNHVLGLLICAVVAGAEIWALVSLVMGLPAKRESPTELLRAAGSLWTSNIFVFASWY
jgi:hypothetical protein